MYKRKEFFSKLQFPHERSKKLPGNYEDVYDGLLYQENVRECILTGKNISFTWNSDGIAVFKSSKFSLWPIYLVINELPFTERFKEENIILAGLWFGNKKPNLNLFLHPLKREMDLLKSGVEFKIADSLDPVLVKGIILCGCCDLPAKALFLNMTQYNGYYACSMCLARGERTERTDYCHAFPVENNPLRTNDSILQCARMAHERGEPVNGIKGPTPLSSVVPNCYRSTGIDIMHCGYHGLMKRLMQFWFEPEYHNSGFSLRNALTITSEFIAKLTPPSYIKRLPRSISEHLSYWKASEFKNWMFYYSLPILCEIMSPDYLNHYMLLVYGLFLLSEDSVSEQMIDTATVLLREYVTQFQVLYVLKYLILNVHQLLHLPQCVRECGPTRTTSCFLYEDLNGKLKKMIHGTRYVEVQICSKVNTLLNLPSIIESLPPHSQAKRFCDNLMSKDKISLNERIGNKIYSVGKYKKERDLPPLILGSLLDIDVDGNYCSFKSLRKGPTMFHAQSYVRAKRTLSSCVSFQENAGVTRLGSIKTFLRVSQCECLKVCVCEAECFAIVSVMESRNPFNIAFPPISLDYIHLCQERDEVLTIPVHKLKDVCFMIVYQSRENLEKIYVVELLNRLETE